MSLGILLFREWSSQKFSSRRIQWGGGAPKSSIAMVCILLSPRPRILSLKTLSNCLYIVGWYFNTLISFLIVVLVDKEDTDTDRNVFYLFIVPEDSLVLVSRVTNFETFQNQAADKEKARRNKRSLQEENQVSVRDLIH